MKTLILLAFMTFAMVGNSQQIDTIYSEVGKVVAKKANLTINQTSGDQLTQIKETITYEKAVKKIETLQRDTANFTQYLQQLNQTENQIAQSRRFYNANVREMNTAVEMFPSSLIAGSFGFKPEQYFEIDDPAARGPVKVEF